MDPVIANIIGQIFGAIAVVLGFLTFQMNTAKKLITVQVATAVAFCLHYLFLGAITGCVMNAVGILRNIIYRYRDRKFLSGKWIPYAFAVIIGGIGFLSWEGWHSLLVIAGLMINTVGLSFRDPQHTRYSIFVSSPLVMVYDVFTMAVGGFIYETVVIISSIIGVIRTNRKQKQ